MSAPTPIRRLSLWRGPLTDADFDAADERERVTAELQAHLHSRGVGDTVKRVYGWALGVIRDAYVNEVRP